MMKKSLFFFTWLFIFGFMAHAQEMSRGLLMMEYQRYRSAENIFNQIVKNDKNDSLAAYWLGMAMMKGGKEFSALDHFNRAQSPNSLLLKSGLAEAYAANGNMEKADKLLSSLPDTMQAINEAVIATAIGKAYMRSGDLEKAEAFFKKAMDLENGSAKSYLLLGNLALGKMNGTEALAYFKEAIIADSNSAPAYYGLAQYYISRKSPANYLPLLAKAISKDSAFTPAWFELYRYAYYHDKPNLRKYYQHYLELADNTPAEAMRLLVMAFNEKKFANVIEIAKRQSMKEKETMPAVYFRFAAISYYKLKAFGNAFRNISRYMALMEPIGISSYDAYLAAQFALALDKKDSMAISFIYRASQIDSLSQYRPLYAAAMANHYLAKKDGFNATLWKEKLLPYKQFAMEAMYKVAKSWHALGEDERADSLISAFCIRYPNAYKGLYLKASIRAGKTGSPLNGDAAVFFASFVEKAAGIELAENKIRLEHAYKYLGDYYFTIKEYPRALQYFQQLSKFYPKDKNLAKTIRELKKTRLP